MNKKIYIAPQTEELLPNIAKEVLAGESNEDGTWGNNSDTNQFQFEEETLETAISSPSLWDE